MNNCHSEWLKLSKCELIQCSYRNLKMRINRIIDIVQQELLSSMTYKLFVINKEDESKMINDVNKFVSNWTGVRLNCCENKKNSYKEYHETSTNWFNRNKSKIYGNSFFYPVIFKHILNVCISVYSSHFCKTLNYISDLKFRIKWYT